MFNSISNNRTNVFSTPKTQYHKVDTQDIKDNLSAIIKDAGDIIDGIKSDLKEANQKSLAEISNNLNSLLKKDARESERGGYNITGVSFSEEEYASASNLLHNTISTLNDNNHDYSRYASYAIAKNAISNLTEGLYPKEQSEVINNALSSFIDNENTKNQNLLANFGKTKNEYYTSVDLQDKKSENQNTDYASNQELIDKITTLFSRVNFNNPNDIENAVKEYQKLVAPAYNTNQDDTTTKLENDANYIKNSISNITATSNTESLSLNV